MRRVSVEELGWIVEWNGRKTGTVQGDFVIRFQSRASNPAEKCSCCGLDPDGILTHTQTHTHTDMFRGFSICIFEGTRRPQRSANLTRSKSVLQRLLIQIANFTHMCDYRSTSTLSAGLEHKIMNLNRKTT